MHPGQHSADPQIGNETSQVAPGCLKPLQGSHITTDEGFNDHVDRHSHPVGGEHSAEGHHPSDWTFSGSGMFKQP